MTAPESKPTTPSPIELEPLGSEVIVPNDRLPPPPIFAAPSFFDDGAPLPDRDGMRCPNCDYDVRGLPSRICPECGNTFRVSDVKKAGLPYVPGFEEDFKAIRRANIHRYVGFALIAASMLTWGVMGVHPVIVIAFTIPLILIGMLVTTAFQRPFETGVFITGLICAGVSAFFIFVFF